MRPVEFYLKELLFDYDCVTIPGLGGFIMQSHHARINRSKNRIAPPSKHAAFNSLLNHDDGLLVSTIARAERIPYREAGDRVHDFAGDCKRKISAGEIIMLAGIGELYSGPGGGILFRPLNQVNFYSGVYGMDILNLHPLTDPRIQARISKKPVDRKPVPSEERKTAPVKWTLIFSIPVILFLLYGIIFPSSLHNFYTNYSGLLTEIVHRKNIEKPVASRPVDIKKPVENVTVVVPDKPVITPPEPDQDAKVIPVVVTAPAPAQKYYIIGGCFQNEENAEKFLADLINRGFEAEKAGTTNSGHVRISYKSFNDKASALPFLQKIRTEENTSAWLLKY